MRKNYIMKKSIVNVMVILEKIVIWKIVFFCTWEYNIYSVNQNNWTSFLPYEKIIDLIFNFQLSNTD